MSTTTSAPTTLIDTVKDNSVNLMIQFYGMVKALKARKLPSNKQIINALNSLLATKILSNQSSDLSQEGLNLISNLNDVVNQAKTLLLAKNESNLFQNFIWKSQSVQTGSNLLANLSPQTSAAANRQVEDALKGIRTLVTLTIIDGQFRKFLGDASIILRDLAENTAQEAVQPINLSKEDLSQVDYFVEIDDPDRFSNISLCSEPQCIFDSCKAKNKSGKSVPQYEGPEGGQSAPSPINSFTDKFESHAISSNPENNAREAFEPLEQRTSLLMAKISPQRQKQTISRIKELLARCQVRDDFRKAVVAILDLAETVACHGAKLHEPISSAPKAHTTDAFIQIQAVLKVNAAPVDQIWALLTKVKVIIQKFADETSMDGFFAIIDDIYHDVDQNPELEDWLKQVRIFFHKCLKNKGYIMNEIAINEWNILVKERNFLTLYQYRHHIERLIGEIEYFIDRINQDPESKNFANAIVKLFADMGLGKDNKSISKPKLLKDLIQIILPSLFESLRYVPIPRIEYCCPDFLLVVENLVMESENFFPEIIEAAHDNHFKWDRKKAKNIKKDSTCLKFSGIHMDLRDVSFHLEMKRNYPYFSDSGIMDIFLGGSGLSLTINMTANGLENRQSFFKIDKVDVDIDIKNLKIKFKKSRHKLPLFVTHLFLIKIVCPIFLKIIEKKIRERASWLDFCLYQIEKEVKRIMEKNDGSENPIGIYQCYFQIAYKIFSRSKICFHDYTPGVIARVATTMNDIYFNKIDLSGGIGSIILEYQDLAKKGDAWESPVFNISSVAPSNVVPESPEVVHQESSTLAQDTTTEATEPFTTDTIQPPHPVGRVDTLRRRNKEKRRVRNRLGISNYGSLFKKFIQRSYPKE